MIHINLLTTSDTYNDLQAMNLFQTIENKYNHHLKIHKYLINPTSPMPNAEILESLDCIVFAYGEARPVLPTLFQSINKAPNLKFINVGWTGTDGVRWKDARKRNVVIKNSPGVSAIPIAHSSIGAVLMLSRGFLNWRRSQRLKEWKPLPGHIRVVGDNVYEDRKVELVGQKMVIFGYGSIGREIAKIANVLGIRVIAVHRNIEKSLNDPFVEKSVTPSQLKSVVSSCDFLMNCAPLNDDTKYFISDNILASMPRGSFVLNVGRGKTIEEAALIRHLQSQHIAGAYLDVVDQEPLDANSVLWDMENVIISPHNSHRSEKTRGRSLNLLRSNLSEWIEEQYGEELDKLRIVDSKL